MEPAQLLWDMPLPAIPSFTRGTNSWFCPYSNPNSESTWHPFLVEQGEGGEEEGESELLRLLLQLGPLASRSDRDLVFYTQWPLWQTKGEVEAKT